MFTSKYGKARFQPAGLLTILWGHKILAEIAACDSSCHVRVLKLVGKFRAGMTTHAKAQLVKYPDQVWKHYQTIDSLHVEVIVTHPVVQLVSQPAIWGNTCIEQGYSKEAT